MKRLTLFKYIRLISSIFSICLSGLGTVVFWKAQREVLKPLEFGSVSKFPLVSVIVPARNEQDCIEKCLSSILEQTYPNLEVIVVNDNSTDQTAELIAKIAVRYPVLKIVNITSPLVEGWLGKTNALWQGYLAARANSEWLLFVDADTSLKPGALEASLAHVDQEKLDLFSLIPEMKLEVFWFRVMAAELFKFYNFAANNPFYPIKPGSIEEGTAVGPFILARRSAYQLVDGHRAVKNCVLEDVELARQFRVGGYTTKMQLGTGYVEMTPYNDFREAWEGVTKNLFVVAHQSWRVVAYVILVEWLYGMLQIGLLINGTVRGEYLQRGKRLVWWSNLVAVLGVIGLHGAFNREFKVPISYALCYPLAAILTTIAMLDSAIQVTLFKKVSWKGRKVKL